MRVLLLSELGSTHTYRWASTLSGMGLRVSVFSLEDGDTSAYASCGVQVYVAGVSLQGRRTLRARLSYVRALPALLRAIRRARPDIAHAHYATHHGLLLALMRLRPSFLSVWGSDVYQFPRRGPLARALFRYVLSRPSYLLSTSHAMAVEAARYTRRHFHVIPFGVDTDRFAPIPSARRDGPPLFGCVKWLRPIYGIDILLRAFARLRAWHVGADPRLEIVGSGPELGNLQRLARELGVGHAVHFAGFVPNDRLPARYARYTAAVFPSRGESFGVSALEAMACGCPVITSDAEGFLETNPAPRTGLITPRGDVDALASAMSSLMLDPSLRDAMAAQARNHVREHYQWARNAQQLVDLYREALRGVGKRHTLNWNSQ